MYFFAIVKNSFNDQPWINCGDLSLVDVDGRYTLNNQYCIAAGHFKKRGLKLIGIACFKKISDKKMVSSIKVNDNGSLDSTSLTAFNHIDFF